MIQKYNLAQELITEIESKIGKDEVYLKSEIDTLLEKYYTKDEIDRMLAQGGVPPQDGGNNTPLPGDYYTKNEIDQLLQTIKDELNTSLDSKVDADEVYTKQEIDEKLQGLGNGGGDGTQGGGTLVDGYTKTEVDAKLDEKANTDDVYTKIEVDQKIADLGGVTPGGGNGDMTKATYDTNNNGMVDKAETLEGLTVTVEELNHMDGVTSNIQDQLDDKYSKVEVDDLINKGGNHTHDNKDILDRFSVSDEGDLQFDNQPIMNMEEDIDLSPYMKTDKYASTVNDGNVKKADYAEKITGEDKLQPLMYRGTNAAGELGYHYLPIEDDAKGELDQRIILNAENNKVYMIDMASELKESRAIIQAYKFVEGEKNIIRTAKTFNNGDQENFYYDKDNIVFDNGCSIKTKFDIISNKNNGIYETELIDKTKFQKFTITRNNKSSTNINDITPKMTGPTSPSPYSVKASSEYSSSWQGWKAFDGAVSFTADIGWVTASGYNVAVSQPYIKMDFGNTVRVNEIWLGAYMYNSYHATSAKIEYSDDDNIYHTIVDKLNLTYKDSPYHKYEFDKTAKGRYFKITITSGISTSYSGFSEIRFIYRPDTFLIKKDDELYTIDSNGLVKIEEGITKDVFENVAISIDYINSNLDILPEVFSLISYSETDLIINGFQDRSQMIIASNDLVVTIQEYIDYFKCESNKTGNGDLRIVFSTDRGATWKTHDGDTFVDMNIEIPHKEFSELTDEEIIKWNEAKDEILNSGISTLESIDFNTIDFRTIRFAYVLSIDDLSDTSTNSKLIWQFDSNGSMKQMKDTEFDVKVHSDSLEFKPLINNSMIKINVIPNGVVFETVSSGSGEGGIVDAYTKVEVDAKLREKANITDVYTKTETYSKTEVDNLIAGNHDGGEAITPINAYTKDETNQLLETKASKDEVYTKEEVNQLITNNPGSGGTGDGDMTKAVYDADNDGIVDTAKTLHGLNVSVTELNTAHDHENIEVLNKLTERDSALYYGDNVVGVTNLGDMTKAVYDADNDGIVDTAKTLDGLTVEVAVLNNAHNHDNKDILDRFAVFNSKLQYNGENVLVNDEITQIKKDIELIKEALQNINAINLKDNEW